MLDRVEERSWWTFQTFEQHIRMHESITNAVASGAISAAEGRQWLAEQRQRAANGTFRAELTKVLWVAATT